MKYLNDYTQDLQTSLFNSTGAFFAFSKSQFDEAKQEGIAYVDMGAGMLCPKDNAKTLMLGLESINKNGIAQDVKENGIKAIIHRELGNHEAQITGDIDNTVDVLSDYPITEEMVQTEYASFFQKCVDNDWF